MDNKVPDNLVAELNMLQQTPGWIAIQKRLGENIENIENKILSLTSGEWSELRYNKHDLLRESRRVLKSMQNIDETLKEHYQGSVITVKHNE